jgi:hypothetical protein
MWWAAWWPWMVVWLATMLAVIAAAGTLYWRRRATRPPGQKPPGICVYLDDKRIMDIWQIDTHGSANKIEVEEKISSGKKATIGIKLASMSADADRSADREVTHKSTKIVNAVAVIDIILDILKSADNVVDIDLIDSCLTPNAALSRKLSAGPAPKVAGLASLDGFKGYVSVRGKFQKETSDPAQTTTTTFSISNGDDSRKPPVRVICTSVGMRDHPETDFTARCISPVLGWNPRTQVLTVDPIAIFRP